MFNCHRTQTAEAGQSRQVRKQMAMSEKIQTEPQTGETTLSRARDISEGSEHQTWFERKEWERQ